MHLTTSVTSEFGRWLSINFQSADFYVHQTVLHVCIALFRRRFRLRGIVSVIQHVFIRLHSALPDDLRSMFLAHARPIGYDDESLTDPISNAFSLITMRCTGAALDRFLRTFDTLHAPPRVNARPLSSFVFVVWVMGHAWITLGSCLLSMNFDAGNSSGYQVIVSR